MAPKPTYSELLTKIKNLEQSVKIYRSLADNSSDLLYRTNLQGEIIFISRSVTKLSGYTVEEAIGMQMAEEVYLVPEERKKFTALLTEKGHVKNFEARLRRKDGSVWWASTNAHFFKDEKGEIGGVEGITRDVTELKNALDSQKGLIKQLQEALDNVQTLRGLLPICSRCKKIRDDKGYWGLIESYIETHSEAKFSHGLCPVCSEELYGDKEWYRKMKDKKMNESS
ncbi:PAS domain S-box-containing protein [Desulfatibacillum alkenivorans DSM 16219]|jgi:PAS domain S-box-containing protein|uniref:histidine kinase n=1 Tax=Desulfatibacillum alkenivorans DSM 16219 TaxID=1121393 RepID=A0A1M6NPA2_9BACT|nr:PAS domain S-box-containing protein [Desulfatibacillum alkenivorans DSM 16219]